MDVYGNRWNISLAMGHEWSDNEKQMRRLECYRTDAGKRRRVQRKINRAEEHEIRWMLIILTIMLHIENALMVK